MHKSKNDCDMIGCPICNKPWDDRSALEIKYEELRSEVDKLVEALEFYENVSRLMMQVRDIPEKDGFGFPNIIKEQHYMDNGDRARSALTEFHKKYPKGEK
jgi:hypothetical protein